MDFSAPQSAKSEEGKKRRTISKWLKIGYTALLFSATGLIVAVIIYLALGGNANEAKYVKDNQYQALQLANGQAYYGHITNLSGKFVRIQDVFYLSENQTLQGDEQTGSSSLQLIKLGCERHSPDDEIIISRDQLSYWENLDNNGELVKKIDEFKTKNPNGQKCTTSTTQSNSTNTHSSTQTNTNSSTTTEQKTNTTTAQ